MKVYYRISDKSYVKGKLPGINKELCLKNFCSSFPTAKIICIADNCSYETIKMVKNHLYQRDSEIYETKLGNAGSFRHCVLDACSLSDPNEIIYIVEDDYLHKDINLEQYVEEGLTKSRYTTLFDHPDKYESEYDFGEICKVFKGKLSHWRTSISTTMTIATKVAELKKDLDIWMKWTDGNHPNDHLIFSEINERQKNSLSVSIPGLSFHTDLTYFEAKGIQPNIPAWLMEYIKSFHTSENLSIINEVDNDLTKLMILASISFNK